MDRSFIKRDRVDHEARGEEMESWAEPLAPKELKEGKMKSVKTLIIEDSAIFRRLLKETLISRFPDMVISEAVDGAEGMESIKDSIPDLIFMDIRLPGESGLELTKKIKAQHPNVVVIILTGHDTPEYREAASQYQADYFLSKGLTTRKGILTLVRSIILKN